MKLKKIESLIDIAAVGISAPEKVKIESMDIDKAVYLQKDTLIPVFVYFANVLSINVYGKPIINISITKSNNTLCLALVEDKEDTDDDAVNSDAVKILFLMESIHQIMGLSYSNKPNLTLLVKNWRRILADLENGEDISYTKDVEKLIVEHLPHMKQKSDIDKKIG
jgi:hypothetical protein